MDAYFLGKLSLGNNVPYAEIDAFLQHLIGQPRYGDGRARTEATAISSR